MTNLYRLPGQTAKDHLFVQDEDDSTTLVRVCKLATAWNRPASTTSAHFAIASHLEGWLWDGSTLDDFGRPGGVCSFCIRTTKETTTMNPTPTPGADIRASLTTVHRTADRLIVGDRISMSHGGVGTIVAIDRPRTVRDRKIMQVTITAGSGDFTVGVQPSDRFVITDPVMSDPINRTTEGA